MVFAIPVDSERMSLSVERAGVVAAIAHYRDFLAEVDVGGHLGIEVGFSVVHAVAESFPIVFRRDRKWLVSIARATLRPCRHGQHEGEDKEAEPLNNVFVFHC